MKTPFLIVLIYLLLLSSCFKGEKVDLIIHNGEIHSMNEQGETFEAIAIRNGKIIELGPNRQILNKYRSKETLDAKGKSIYPGLMDSHGHIMMYIEKKLSANLSGVQSYSEMIVKLKKYKKSSQKNVIIGRGWDQSLWANNKIPTNELLNKEFPNTPVCLYRVDEHLALLNNSMLQLIGCDSIKNIQGGVIDTKTGILTDNALNLVVPHLPKHSYKEKLNAFKEIENELFSYGITGVHEAGISNDDLQFLEESINKNEISLNIYAMLLPSKKNIDFAKKNGPYINKNLNIRSFKIYGDGSLGSRGALLKKPYHDQNTFNGTLITPLEKLNEIALICEQVGYQMNIHAIGDSMISIAIDVIKELNDINKDHRSRIEHVQIIDHDDLSLLNKYGIFPSVQPSHAISDQRWVMDRIGENRKKMAYAYKSILDNTQIMAIGTDFPVEVIDPFRTIYAAVKRKDTENYPENGFLANEAISINDCLKGMTIWSALSSFQEKNLGSLEEGKDATFIILEDPIDIGNEFKRNNASKTYILGELKFDINNL